MVSYGKNYLAVHFKLDYVNADGDISNYYPDFLVKLSAKRIFIVETKGQEDLDDLVIGGRSMGGRMCTMAVADAPESLTIRGVICVSYPLHPPKKPYQLRTEHLPRIRSPSLFVSGTRDEFGSPDELTTALAAIPISPTVEFIDGGRHELRGHDDLVALIVAQWLIALQ